MSPAAPAPPRRHRFAVPPDHPALPGHFPGRPVVPGVLLLAEVAACIAAGGRMAALEPWRLRRVKFTAAVLPGETVEVELGPAGPGGALPFACTAGGRRVLQGTCDPPGSGPGSGDASAGGAAP